jgi:PmbA protein
MEEAAWGQGGDKVVSIMAGASDEMVEGVILTSNGFEGYRQSTDFSAGTFVTVGDEDGRRPNGYDYASCRMYRKLPASAEIGMSAARRATAGLGAKKIETQALPVIIENRIVPEIMDGFFEALTGWNLYQKRSFLADKKGQAVAGDKLTLIDDPFIPEGHGSWLFDADGIATRKRTVLDAGVLKEFYIDWYYSRKLGCEPTASGHGNMIIPPGQRSVADIMKDVGRGILVTDFIGGNSNPTTGDFSIGIFGQYFEKGEIVHPVSEMNVADNHLKFWKKLTECANDPWLYSAWRTPSIVFADVVVSGT